MFGEIFINSLVIGIDDVVISNISDTHYESFYHLEVWETNCDKEVFKKTIFTNLRWEDCTLSYELYDVSFTRKSGALRQDRGGEDNNFGVSIIGSVSDAKIYFEVGGTGNDNYLPIPEGTAYFQDVTWKELYVISKKLFEMELKGLITYYLDKVEAEKNQSTFLLDDNARERKERLDFRLHERLQATQELLEYYTKQKNADFIHPGDLEKAVIERMEIIKKRG